MFEFCVLASGSKANCVYVAAGDTKVLVDCGLSAREAAVRLGQHGIDADSICAIVITHEHSDHTSGVRVFSKRHRVPVYSNPATRAASRELAAVSPDKMKMFSTGTAFTVGALTFEPFSISHDAADPVGFRISCGNIVLGLVTDLGQVTTLVKERLSQVDALVLESNHDLQMLQDCSYPWELKQRIRSRNGHLSNICAGLMIEELSRRSTKSLQVAVAAHISENSNTPELALEAFRSFWHRGENAATPEFAAAGASSATGIYRL